jgi:hypothetical protein
MDIVTTVFGQRKVTADPVTPTIFGVTMLASGSSIVSVTYDARTRPPTRVCTGIERLPYDVAKLATRLQSLELGPKDVIVVDGAGAGMALWIALGSPRGRRHFKLYEGTGRERQRLVDPFPAMMINGSFRFAPNLAHQDAMLKALASYRKEVVEDGIVGSELVVGLFLATSHQPAVPPQVR